MGALNITWALLNVALIFGFLYLCFHATKLIRQKLGILASILFVIGLLSFVGNNNATKKNSSEEGTWKFRSEEGMDPQHTQHKHVVLETDSALDRTLFIRFGMDPVQKQYVPVNAYTTLSGFVSGKAWKAYSIVVNPVDEKGIFKYNVGAIEEWKLLGVTLYHQPKHFAGTLKI